VHTRRDTYLLGIAFLRNSAKNAILSQLEFVMRRESKFSLVAIVLINLCPVQLGAKVVSPQHEFSERAKTYVTESGVSGVAITIGNLDGLVWSAGIGFSDIEQEVPIKPATTKFRVGSTAKSMTAMGLAMLLESGRLDLDLPIQEYLPAFPEKVEGTVTARMLAGHTAGIRHYNSRQELYSTKHFETVGDSLAIFSSDPLLFKPGSAFSYSSYGYNLLSAVMEQAAGEEFLSFMSNNVFNPIGMSSTTADRVHPIIAHRSRYYELKDGHLINAPWVDNSYKWAGGGFLSTSEDLVRFGLAHLTTEFLNRGTLEMMWTSQLAVGGEETGYGIGWDIEKDDAGRRLIRHSGSSVGGRTELRIYPNEALVIAVITNTTPANLAPLTDDLVNRYLAD
jgi:serine beta-lactamase-like protein LACTB